MAQILSQICKNARKGGENMAKKSIFTRYRLLPLIGVGIIFFILFIAVALLLWGYIAFRARLEVSTAAVFPAILYLLGVFLASALMTFLIRGGTVFPAAIVSIVAAAATLLLAAPEAVTFGNALGKILLTLVSGVLGFTLTKLYFVMRRPLRLSNDRDLSKLRLNEPEQPAPQPPTQPSPDKTAAEGPA